MTLKDIFVPLFGDKSDDALIAMIELLPHFTDAHVAAALMSPIPDSVFMGEGLAGGMALAEIISSTRAEAAAIQTGLRTRLTRTNLAFEQRLTEGQSLAVCDHATVQARHADLTVMSRPNAQGSSFRHEVLEAVLMSSGRPVLLLPSEWNAKDGYRTVFIAWNAGREAARAVADAGPFLAAASNIVVGTVDARSAPRGHGEAPGVDIATHLARHGYAVELRNLDSLGADKADAILSGAKAANADLIVLGGYEHARLQQAIFGGVTRKLIDTSPIPLLLAH